MSITAEQKGFISEVADGFLSLKCFRPVCFPFRFLFILISSIHSQSFRDEVDERNKVTTSGRNLLIELSVLDHLAIYEVNLIRNLISNYFALQVT